jgi:hypothetical protein
MQRPKGLSKHGYQPISPLPQITSTRWKRSRFRRLLGRETIGREVVQTVSRPPRLSRFTIHPRIGSGPDDAGRVMQHNKAQHISLNLEITSSISSRMALAFDQLDSAKAKHPFTPSHASSAEARKCRRTAPHRPAPTRVQSSPGGADDVSPLRSRPMPMPMPMPMSSPRGMCGASCSYKTSCLLFPSEGSALAYTMSSHHPPRRKNDTTHIFPLHVYLHMTSSYS